MSQPKVLLINPSQTFYQNSSDFNAYYPLGLLSIMASIKTNCEVSLYDALIENFKVRKVGSRTIYGSPLSKIKDYIFKNKPDIVGISCPFSIQLSQTVNLSKLIKKINPKILIVVGGPGISVQPKIIIDKFKSIDICISGEGEESFLKIIKNYKPNPTLKSFSKISGLTFRYQNKIITNPFQPITNLDKLPLPAYELIDFAKYQSHPYLYKNRSSISENSISLITSRGCPYNCVFCSVHLHSSKNYRFNSEQYVLNHLELLINKYNIRSFHFEDDNFSLNQNRFEKILDLIIQKNLKIKWDTPNGLRADTMTFPLLKKMKKAGCQTLTIAIESGDQKVLDTIIKKNLNLKNVNLVSKWCRQLKLKLAAFYIIGFPGEKIKNMKTTLDLAINLYRQYQVFPILFIATPLLGTKLHCTCLKNNYLTAKLSQKHLSQATSISGIHLIKTKDFDKNTLNNLIADFESRKNSYRPFLKILTKIFFKK